jgi:DNA-binding MurR/RpiR family transcriptional regulator
MKGKFLMTQNCLGTIHSQYHKFSEKEKMIADYILKKPELVIHRTINEVADDLNIADATVFRFSKRIGFKGFQAMKIALASEVMTRSQTEQKEAPVEEEDSLTEKIFNATIRTLQKTLELNNQDSIKKAVDLIRRSNRVEVYGTGNSALMAMDGFQKLLNSGIRAFSYQDPHYQLLSAARLTRDDAAIIISHSGSNKETMNILKTAKDAGAKTVGITAFPKSPLSLNVDIPLYTSLEETESISAAFASQMAQISLINALCLNILHLE